MGGTAYQSQRGEAQTITLVALCVAGILVAVFFGILPRIRELEACEAEVRGLQAKLDAQTLLQPVHAELQARLKSFQAGDLPVNTRKRLPADQLPGLANVFSSLARQRGLELVYAVPETKSLEAGFERVLMKLLVQGPVTEYRSFLMALIATPFYDRTAHVQISRGAAGEELRVQVWLAIE